MAYQFSLIQCRRTQIRLAGGPLVGFFEDHEVVEQSISDCIYAAMDDISVEDQDRVLNLVDDVGITLRVPDISLPRLAPEESSGTR